ncbi:hypothetical protein Ocin01_07310 [Orchesella cincta]|uniref:Tudor domain-containing protein n=1 Tax=Orchesella cincta TaxID=48709 RepID=A0A1D2N277_ORCCI|nr:hypothetical protein Ocin01_07310 [Orchesella cincta]
MGFERRKKIGNRALVSKGRKNTIKRELFPNIEASSNSGRRETPLVTKEMHLVLSSKGHSSVKVGTGEGISQVESLNPWIGKPIWDPFSSTSWVWNKKVNWLLNQFKTFLEEKGNLSPLTVGELSQADKVIPVGAVEAGVVVYPSNPSEIYIVLENPTYYYSAQQSEWTEIFPAFKSGPEALVGVQALLQLFYKSYKHLEIDLKASFGSYKDGDLVAVKVIRKLNHHQSSRSSDSGISVGEERIDNEYEYQFNRGLVTRIDYGVDGTDLFEYTVYCFDLGYEVIVSEHFLLPLLKPFNLIPPLALRCELYGISPAGEQWNHLSNDYFRFLLQHCRQLSFSFEFCSAVSVPLRQTDLQSRTSSYLVNVEVREFNLTTGSIAYLFNFADEMINNKYAIPWNLTPTRPKVMEGTTVAEVITLNAEMIPDRVTLPFRAGLLLTKFHPKVYDQLPREIIAREIERLFMMRGDALNDMEGVRNRLTIVLPDPNKCLGNRCSVNALMGNEKAKEK